jgi:hypothetical protein
VIVPSKSKTNSKAMLELSWGEAGTDMGQDWWLGMWVKDRIK